MPDWFYRSVSRPLLFALPDNASRRIVLSLMGTLGRLPFGVGRSCIDFLGHMQPPPGLQTHLLDETIGGPIGASCWFDGEGTAVEAWSRFGFGFIELGPCWVSEDGQSPVYGREDASKALRVRLGDGPLNPVRLKAPAAKAIGLGMGTLARLQPRHAKQPEALAWQAHRTIDALDAVVSGYVLDLRRVTASWEAAHWDRFWNEFGRMDKARHALASPEEKRDLRITALMMLVPISMVAGPPTRSESESSTLPTMALADHAASPSGASAQPDSSLARKEPASGEAVSLATCTQDACVTASTASALVQRASQAGVRHWLLENSALEGEDIVMGGATTEVVLAALANFKRESRAGESLWVNAGARQPGDMLQLLEAGARGILVDAGMVYSGPGLVKRTNECIAASRLDAASGSTTTSRAVNDSWFWGVMLGLAMLIGSILAMVIAAGRVVLPYDEAFCGLTRAQIHALNPRLLSFMAHDRISLAGTMIAIGVLYGGLALWGIRRGLHWARVALLWSGGAGFISFFLFLGFGYFDPFHGFVTAILFQLYLLCLVGKERTPAQAYAPEARESAAWRRGQWGQFLLVVHGAGLILAGLTIAGMGVMDVFVPTDLAFLQTKPEALRAASVHLVPIIAHDRATMGGMLIAAGIPFLLAALWGVGRRTRWLWWVLLGSGLPAYLSALGIHFIIGYTDPWHLMPAWLGLGLFACGLGLARSWMVGAAK